MRSIILPISSPDDSTPQFLHSMLLMFSRHLILFNNLPADMPAFKLARSVLCQCRDFLLKGNLSVDIDSLLSKLRIRLRAPELARV